MPLYDLQCICGLLPRGRLSSPCFGTTPIKYEKDDFFYIKGESEVWRKRSVPSQELYNMASLMRICFALLLAVVAHCSPAPPARGPLVKVKNGTYMGVHSQSYNQDYFLGIPFAQAPVGPLRLNFPQPLNSSFTGVKDATKYGPICIGYGVRQESLHPTFGN